MKIWPWLVYFKKIFQITTKASTTYKYIGFCSLWICSWRHKSNISKRTHIGINCAILFHNHPLILSNDGCQWSSLSGFVWMKLWLVYEPYMTSLTFMVCESRAVSTLCLLNVQNLHKPGSSIKSLNQKMLCLYVVFLFYLIYKPWSLFTVVSDLKILIQLTQN